MKKVLLIVVVLMIAVMLTTLFVGCSAEDYKKQYEKKGYTVTMATDDSLSGQAAKLSAKALIGATGIKVNGDLDYIVVGVKDDSIVAVIKFENSKDASNLRKQAKSEAKDSDVKVSGTGKVVKLTINNK